MENCVLCADLKPNEDELVWRGDDCRVILVNDHDLPGFCRVIWNRHQADMTELSHGEREHLMHLVFVVEEAVRHVMKPSKVNLAALGNMVPHIHWHVIPRFKDDAFFPGSIWSARIQETPPAILAERRKASLELPDVIRGKISRLY
ncbi:HIT family protein [Polynucleobacter sp. AP-Melu-500A-A1]|uniref:HIT family protein n=1 Tax=Polynucleobacter sp. AP-Melu-500A-A1 TaxID=2576929 RepID=UPI001C0BBFD8|nr:HIT family protein [Polynucleobacter sp. AP-Melu-500A-A1]MBU3631029.1 HIT family protein [Polynucleobacter sp. AP-Melu-500A-A1]